MVQRDHSPVDFPRLSNHLLLQEVGCLFGRVDGDSIISFSHSATCWTFCTFLVPFKCCDSLQFTTYNSVVALINKGITATVF